MKAENILIAIVTVLKALYGVGRDLNIEIKHSTNANKSLECKQIFGIQRRLSDKDMVGRLLSTYTERIRNTGRIKNAVVARFK